MTRLRALLAAATFAATALAGGCSPTPTACVPDASSTLEIGRGDPSNPTSFSPLSDNATVALTPGNQGGQHIWIQVRAGGVCPVGPRVRLRVLRRPSNLLIGLSQFDGTRWPEVAGQPGSHHSDALAASIDEDQYCQLLNGGEVAVEVRLTDRDGRVLERTVNLVVRGWSPDSTAEERVAREACCADFSNTNCYPLGPPDVSTTDATTDAQDMDASTTD